MADTFAVGIPAFPPHSFAFRAEASPRDIDAHLVERTTLLNALLLNDNRTHELFRTFGGLLDEAQRLAQVADQLARDCGWRDRRHMFTEPAVHDERRSPHCDEFTRRNEAFPWDRLHGFRAEAETLVFTAWQLPRDHARERWSWLVDDLQRLFVLLLLNEIQDQHYTIGLALPPQPVPPIELGFSTRQGESRAAMRDRLRALVDEADDALGPPAPRGGTLLSRESLRRDVVIFYMRQMMGIKWKPLARQYCAKGDQRRSVKHDYARARRLLSEIPA